MLYNEFFLNFYSNPNLYLVEAPSLLPQEITMDPSQIRNFFLSYMMFFQIAKLEEDLKEAEMDVLANEEDDEFK